MKKGVWILIIGAILIIAAIGVYIVWTSNIGFTNIEIPGNSEKNINYNLTQGNYTLIIQSGGKIHYTLFNSTGVITQGNVTQHIVKNIKYLSGKYTLKIKNLENSSIAVIISLKSEESLMSLGIQVLGSGGVCLIGIIMTLVGIWLIIREKRKKR